MDQGVRTLMEMLLQDRLIWAIYLLR